MIIICPSNTAWLQQMVQKCELTNDKVIESINVFLHIKANFKICSLASIISYHLSFFPIFSSMSSIISFVVGKLHESKKEMKSDIEKEKEIRNMQLHMMNFIQCLWTISLKDFTSRGTIFSVFSRITIHRNKDLRSQWTCSGNCKAGLPWDSDRGEVCSFKWLSLMLLMTLWRA